MKQIFLMSISCLYLVFTLSAQTTTKPMRGLTVLEVSAEMAPGLNLFNTLDCTGNWVSGLEMETMWGNPYTTYEMVESMAERGFKTLRIPVSWHPHMGSAPDYTIDEEWMDRVETVVNYALDNGMYAIVNIHHDDEKFTPTYEKQEESTEWVEKVWMQISNRFKDYGDYLLFETLNEPRVVGSPEEWTGGSQEHRDVVNALNLAAVNVIRGSGGNNSERFIMVPQVGANPQAAKEALIIPNGDTNIIVSVHNYGPWSFCLADPGVSVWGTEEEKAALQDDIMSYHDYWVSKGQAVIIGEWGAGDKNNYDQRVNYYRTFAKTCVKGGITPIVWIYGFNRNTLTWEAPMIEEAIFRAYDENTIEVEEILLDVEVDTLYVNETLQLSVQITPFEAVSSTHIIWSSSKNKVANVTENGLVTALDGGKVSISATTFGKQASCNIVIIDTLTQTEFFYEAEDYDTHSGVQVEDCSDENGGQNIGYIENGDWTSYQVTVDSAGIYDFAARVATDASGGTIEITIANKVLGEVQVDPSKTNGWQDWYTTDAIEIDLEEGSYDLKLTFKGGSGSLFNVNWFELKYNRPLENTSVYTSTKNKLKVFPNPVSDMLNIELPVNNSKVELYSITGQKLLMKSVSTKNVHIDVSNIKSGAYILKVSSKDYSGSGKIIIK